MKIRDLSSQFSLLIFSTDIDQGAAIKVSLSRGGYETYYVDNEIAFLDRLAQVTPHLVILSLKSLSTTLSEMVEKINQVSAEIHIIFLSNDEAFQILTDYADYGVVDILSESVPQLDNRVLWSVDRACEKIYLEYQNEQIFSQLKEAQSAKPEVVAMSKTENDSDFFSYKEFILDLRVAQSKEDLIGIMLRSVPEVPLVYLRYLPSMFTFLVTDTSYPAAESFKGLGCRLSAEENKDLAKQIELAIISPPLEELLSQAFRMKIPRMRALLSGSTLEGILVGDAVSTEATRLLNERFAIMSLAYSHFCLEKRNEVVEVMDGATELFNQKYYFKKIEEEYQRARRFQQPLCVVKLGLDDYLEIEKSLGEPARDLIFKNLAGLIQKSSRSHDIPCRTADNEISLILPQCSKSEAEIRAERLRRNVEDNSLINNGLKLTISLGACEYPSMCSSAKKLDEGAARALQFIMSKGSNKLCFFKTPVNHKPDFIISQGDKT
ncbi:MAG: diguanylate cyclase [Bdellovibrionota bacterium]